MSSVTVGNSRATRRGMTEKKPRFVDVRAVAASGTVLHDESPLDRGEPDGDRHVQREESPSHGSPGGAAGPGRL